MSEKKASPYHPVHEPLAERWTHYSFGATDAGKGVASLVRGGTLGTSRRAGAMSIETMAGAGR